MFSSSGDIVCTLIVEMIEVFNERSGAYRKLRLKLGGGGTYCRVDGFVD